MTQPTPVRCPAIEHPDIPISDPVGLDPLLARLRSDRAVESDETFPLGTVRAGMGNNGTDGTEGARTGNVVGSYLHGPILPANPALADALIGYAAEHATGRPFQAAPQDDAIADEARIRQVRRLVRR